MSNKMWLGFLMGISMPLFASALPIENNGNVELSLSETNYNRILIQNDKILDNYFPDGRMLIQHDDSDGGIYVMPVTSEPFTLFLTTEKGRHLSVTISGEPSLGKSIVLAAKGVEPRPSLPTPETLPLKKDTPLVSLIEQMATNTPSDDYKVKPLPQKIERMGNGLILIPQKYWEGKSFLGDVTEIINHSSKTQQLTYQEFESKGIDALKLSKLTLAPNEKAYLYRVKEVGHA